MFPSRVRVSSSAAAIYTLAARNILQSLAIASYSIPDAALGWLNGDRRVCLIVLLVFVAAKHYTNDYSRYIFSSIPHVGRQLRYQKSALEFRIMNRSSKCFHWQ